MLLKNIIPNKSIEYFLHEKKDYYTLYSKYKAVSLRHNKKNGHYNPWVTLMIKFLRVYHELV